MCGRMTCYTPLEHIARLAGVETNNPGGIVPRYNIPPGQSVVNVQERLGHRSIELYPWGFIPHWAKDASRKHINATAERITTAPTFRDAFRRGQHSLIFADGFYEWDAQKQPYYIKRKDGEPMAFAGIFDIRKEEPTISCAVITTAADELVAPIHDRMPAILPASVWDAWLDPNNRDAESLRGMLRPAPEEELEIHRVSRDVNSPKNDDRRLTKPI